MGNQVCCDDLREENPINAIEAMDVKISEVRPLPYRHINRKSRLHSSPLRHKSSSRIFCLKWPKFSSNLVNMMICRLLCIFRREN